MGQEFINTHLLEEQQAMGGPYSWAFVLIEIVLTQQQLNGLQLVHPDLLG